MMDVVLILIICRVRPIPAFQRITCRRSAAFALRTFVRSAAFQEAGSQQCGTEQTFSAVSRTSGLKQSVSAHDQASHLFLVRSKFRSAPSRHLAKHRRKSLRRSMSEGAAPFRGREPFTGIEKSNVGLAGGRGILSPNTF